MPPNNPSVMHRVQANTNGPSPDRDTVAWCMCHSSTNIYAIIGTLFRSRCDAVHSRVASCASGPYIVREVFVRTPRNRRYTFVFVVPRLVQLMELFVRHTGSGLNLRSFSFVFFPAVFTFTLPMAVLIGVLLGLAVYPRTAR